MSAPERSALCAGRAAPREEKLWSGGVSDPAPALFGPLRAGSLTPTCLVSVVRQIAARMYGEIVAGFVLQFEAKIWPRARRTTSVMIVSAHNVVP